MPPLSLALFCVTLAAQDLTPAREAAISRQMAQEVRRSTTPVESQAVQDYVAQLGARLSTGHTFSVITPGRTDELYEPMVLPGGYVFVPASLILAAENESEFAGVLAQAMARGPLLSKGTGKPGVVPLYSFGPSPLMPLASMEPWREQELKADASAVVTVSRAGFDPAALLRFIDRVQPPDRQYTPFPPRAPRIAALQKAISDLPQAVYSESGEFKRIQELVRPAPPKPRSRPSLFTK